MSSSSRVGAVRRVAVAILAVVALSLAAPVRPAGAEVPAQVRDAMGASGVYVAGRAADRDALESTIDRARASGHDLAIVVVREPRPHPVGFALRLRQLEVAETVLVFDLDGRLGVSSDAVERTDLFRASAAAEQEATIERKADAFVTTLDTEPEQGVADIVVDLIRVVLFAVLALGLAVMAEQAFRAYRRRRRTAPPSRPTVGGGVR